MQPLIANYRPTPDKTWTGRKDGPEDIRWHQRVQLVDLLHWNRPADEHAFVLLGFCCDEGVRRNQGRTGARNAPQALRKAMASLAWHLPEAAVVLDAGDIFCHDTELEKAQASLAAAVALIRALGGFPVVLGGGHETAWGSYSGLRKEDLANESLGIINLDAHFDLRLYEKGPHSGSPFFQMAEDCHARQLPFHYLCIGVQPGGNTASLFARAHELGVSYLTPEDMAPAAAIEGALQAFLEQHDRIYLSIDLDVFDAAFAPGVSAPCAAGISPLSALPLLRQIAASGKLMMLDLCELNPDFDRDGMTAKLGATLIAGLLRRVTPLSKTGSQRPPLPDS